MPPFGGSSVLGFRKQGASMDPHSHHASESLSSLLNTDTTAHRHTHTHTGCFPCQAPLHCTDGPRTEDTLCL